MPSFGVTHQRKQLSVSLCTVSFCLRTRHQTAERFSNKNNKRHSKIEASSLCSPPFIRKAAKYAKKEKNCGIELTISMGFPYDLFISFYLANKSIAHYNPLGAWFFHNAIIFSSLSNLLNMRKKEGAR